VRGASGLAASLRDRRREVLLYKDLATLRADEKLFGSVEELRWRGPQPQLAPMCERLDLPDFEALVLGLWSGR